MIFSTDYMSENIVSNEDKGSRSNDILNVEKLLRDHQNLKSVRSSWEEDWNEVARFILFGLYDFNSRSFGQRPSTETQVYTSIGADSHERFKAGLQGYLTPPSESWLSLGLADPRIEPSFEVQSWLQDCERKVLGAMERGQFYHRQLEAYSDLGAFGNGVIYSEGSKDNLGVQYTSIPLQQCYIEQDAGGVINELHRSFGMTLDQMHSRYTEVFENSPKLMNELKKNRFTYKEVLHIVRPRKDGRVGFIKTKKPFESIVIYPAEKIVLEEGGYDEFPYHVCRWETSAGVPWSRGIGVKVLPELKLLNDLAKYGVKGTGLQTLPPSAIPMDGFMGEAIDMTPGALNYYDSFLPNAGFIPLDTRANPAVSFEVARQREGMVQALYFVDLLLDDKRAEMSATESTQRYESRLRQLAPHLGRAIHDLQGLVVRTFAILARQGVIEPPPEEVSKLRISFLSPLAQAQRSSKLGAFDRIFQYIQVLAQVSPEVTDNIDADATMTFIADALGLSKRVMRDPEQRDAQRQARQQQQMEAQASAQAKELGSAYKDVSQGDAALAQAQVAGGSPNVPA